MVTEPQPVNPDGTPIPVPTDVSDASVPVPTPALGDPRIAELEARNAELLAHIEELEADPYRPIVGGQLGEITPALQAYEAQQLLADQQAWDRTYGDVAEASPVAATAENEGFVAPTPDAPEQEEA